jgi:hypothetical protein
MTNVRIPDGSGWKNRVGEHEGIVATLNPLPFSSLINLRILATTNNVVNMVSSINLPPLIPFLPASVSILFSPFTLPPFFSRSSSICAYADFLLGIGVTTVKFLPSFFTMCSRCLIASRRL